MSADLLRLSDREEACLAMATAEQSAALPPLALDARMCRHQARLCRHMAELSKLRAAFWAPGHPGLLDAARELDMQANAWERMARTADLMTEHLDATP